MSEEELQKQFETTTPPQGTDPDVAAYRKIFAALGKEPKLTISSDFAGAVVKRIVTKKKREARRDFFWLTFGVVFLLVGLIVTAVVAGLRFELGFLKEMSGILIFSAAMILGFNWLEKKTLAKKMS